MGNELALVFFSSLIDLGCGLFIALCVNEWLNINDKIKFKGSVVALVILALGGFSSVLHLGHPERIFGALGHPTSGIFLESSGIGITAIVILVYIYMLKQKTSKQTLKAITLVGAIVAAILAFAVGDSYVMSARPAWDTLTLPFVYLASAGLMGALAYAALLVEPSDELVIKMKRIVKFFIVIQAAAIMIYLIALGSADYPDTSRSVGIVLVGALAPMFWVGIVFVGLIAPMCLVSFKAQDVKTAMMGAPFAVGLICALAGALAYRVLMFNLGTPVWQFF
ncbi:MAG: dimethyl sulfoxide reductase anchor subunit [Campylobacter sp.]|nr:dimethyl sulfoxide reductase anchor subunit [Campylobacter sp.]